MNDDNVDVCILSSFVLCFFFFKQKTAYEMRISDWSSDVCSSDLIAETLPHFDQEYGAEGARLRDGRSEEHTSELQSLMRISYAVFCLKKKTTPIKNHIYDVKKNSVKETDMKHT